MDDDGSLESQIAIWRSHMLARRGLNSPDVEELEAHLRDQIAELADVGLREDEAFLVAVKRMGNLAEVSKEFAREHSERLWTQLLVGHGDTARGESAAGNELPIVIGLALAAALVFKVPELFGIHLYQDDGFYPRNLALFVLPFLAGYLLWKRGADRRLWIGLAAVFVVAALLANVFPFPERSNTAILLAIHLPVVLWLVVGLAYVEGDWRSPGRRMDYIRFTGEWFIYYVLIALGGGVLTGLTVAVFGAIGLDAEAFVMEWLVPCGAIGAVIVAAWLVEAKQSVIENMAPVLTRVFTPLFALMILASLIALAWTGNTVDIEREVLIIFDLLLVLVLGLLLYTISARDPQASPAVGDYFQIALVTGALLLDLVALTAIVGRISEFGFTPNRTAALGLNIVLLVNLAWSVWLLLGFLRRSRPFADLERWQTSYVPVYLLWASLVVVGFPPMFGFA
jgi:hypothetical protein